MKQPSIVIVGHVCIDRNTVEGDSYIGWGSPALYMATYFQQNLGVTPRIVTTYATDFLRYAADFSLYPALPNASQTLTYENIITDGKRTQYCRHAKATELPLIDEVASRLLHKADIVFLAPLTPYYNTTYVDAVMSMVSASCLRILLPQGYFRQINAHGLVRPREYTDAISILPHFDVMILSDEDHPQALTAAKEWHEQSPGTAVVVTQNVQGATLFAENERTTIPTVPVPVDRIVDSVGCGGVFSAATAYHLYKTHDMYAAILQGHAAAGERLVTPGFGRSITATNNRCNNI